MNEWKELYFVTFVLAATLFFATMLVPSLTLSPIRGLSRKENVIDLENFRSSRSVYFSSCKKNRKILLFYGLLFGIMSFSAVKYFLLSNNILVGIGTVCLSVLFGLVSGSPPAFAFAPKKRISPRPWVITSLVVIMLFLLGFWIVNFEWDFSLPGNPGLLSWGVILDYLGVVMVGSLCFIWGNYLACVEWHS